MSVLLGKSIRRACCPDTESRERASTEKGSSRHHDRKTPEQRQKEAGSGHQAADQNPHNQPRQRGGRENSSKGWAQRPDGRAQRGRRQRSQRRRKAAAEGRRRGRREGGNGTGRQQLFPANEKLLPPGVPNGLLGSHRTPGPPARHHRSPRGSQASSAAQPLTITKSVLALLGKESA